MIVSSCVAPICRLGFAGVIAIESNTAGVTVSVVVALRAPDFAVMTLAPIALPVAVPVVLIVATFRFAELKVAMAVILFDVPSE